MDSLLVPLLFAGCAALVVWFVASLLSTLFNPEKRKLQERLKVEVQARAEAAAAARSAITAQHEVKGLSALLVRHPIFARLNRRVVQAFPDMSVAQFLLFALLFGMVALVIAMAVFDSVILGTVV